MTLRKMLLVYCPLLIRTNLAFPSLKIQKDIAVRVPRKWNNGARKK